MQRFLIFFLCIFCFSNLHAQDSNIGFTIKNLGINVDGHFNTFTIIANFDANGRLNTITSTIEVSSIETGIDSRDEHILGEDYFHMEKYATITLKSTEVKTLKANSYQLKANLTIKGKTKQIKIPVKVQKINDTYKITSYFEINRKDFDVGGGSFVMSKTVKINVLHYQNL
ncbi:YceI family protein [uncultured Winogradskyella sp.]|uniref:YceI family protein n=1 Tax=uncultured Winogradskyella sp. TaxID=395353 RepID=UPI002637BF76|nr:YceI family protein [uncultured Winogradskyella sp.]